MPSFGRLSEQRLATLHPDLRRVLREAIRVYDFTILCGRRSESDQNEAYRTGASKLPYPKSRHNADPSEAVDVAPWPIDWNNRAEFFYLAGILMGTAFQLGVRLTWGGRWKSLVDLPHFELEED